jgi:hypothetical protein
VSALPQDAKDTLKRSPLASGRFIDPWDVKPEEIFIEDIAQGLANINRYNGQFGSYTVAQHSVFVSRILERENKQLAGLLHDAPEYITGDLAHHIKHGPGFLGMLWHQLDAPIQAAVEVRFGLEPGDLYDADVKRADNCVFNLEWDFHVRGNRAAGDIIFVPWDADRARVEFLDCFARYTGG